jgi:RecJ-like exonuclease
MPSITQKEYRKGREEEEDRDYKRTDCFRCKGGGRVSASCFKCPRQNSCSTADNKDICPEINCPACKGSGRVRVER